MRKLGIAMLKAVIFVTVFFLGLFMVLYLLKNHSWKWVL